MSLDALSIPEISEAIKLLTSYEDSRLSYSDTNNFKRGIEILNDYLSDNPDTPFREFIQNQKLAYVRQMLKRLAKVNKADPGASLGHIALVVLTMKDGADDIMKSYPELGKDFAALMAAWTNELAEVWAEQIAQVLVDKEMNA